MRRISLECGVVSALEVGCAKDRLTGRPAFSKCAESIECGKRLENLSWRMWNRETLCCPPSTNNSNLKRDVPELSGSVDSCSTDCGRVDSGVKFSPRLYESRNPVQTTKDSSLARRRGTEKHLTPQKLSKMVANIQDKKGLEPLSPTLRSFLPSTSDVTPRPTSPSAKTETAEQEEIERHSQRSSDSCYSHATVESNYAQQSVASDTSVSSAGVMKSSSVVRGFSPSHISSSLRSKTSLAPARPSPVQPKALPSKAENGRKKQAVFTLGSSSGEDDGSSFEERVASLHPQRSSLSDGLNKSIQGKKQTSFRDIVESRTIQESGEDNEDAIASDDDISDSAIDDDDDEDEEDDEDWEDSDTESGHSSVEEKPMFQRVDSRPNLVSRRSMLTTLMHEPQRAAALANAASQSQPAIRRSRNTSPNGPSAPGSPQETETALEIKDSGVPRSKPIIVTTSNSNPPLLSPRTTRRNMLNNELTASLRQHLLWERQQKNTTVNAMNRRRHTAHDMANLKEYPAGQAPKEASKNNSWNPNYDHGPWEYHTKGW
ncbi:MAG: hypothetical protein Q9227_002295 [Pyrenula ochraceoflavens]